MIRYLSFTLLCVLSFAQHASAQQLSNIVKHIREFNEVHCEGVSVAGEKSNQFRNYEKLVKVAKIADLLEMTNDSNGVVNCYAAWALIEKHYDKVPEIFSKYSKNDKDITSFCGCFREESKLSEVVYFRYRNQAEKSRDNKIMRAIDSFVLYNDHSGWLLLHFALKSGIFPRTYNKRLELLAFERLNMDAIFYFKRQYPQEYRSQVKAALLQYLDKTDFSTEGAESYFDTISELLKYKDATINSTIIAKLNNDTHWKRLYGKFYGLFGEYDLEKSLPEY